MVDDERFARLRQHVESGSANADIVWALREIECLARIADAAQELVNASQGRKLYMPWDELASALREAGYARKEFDG